MHARQILIIDSLDQESLSCEARAVRQEFGSNSAPGKFIALDIRDLVVTSFLSDTLVQAQQVDVPATNLWFTI